MELQNSMLYQGVCMCAAEQTIDPVLREGNRYMHYLSQHSCQYEVSRRMSYLGEVSMCWQYVYDVPDPSEPERPVMKERGGDHIFCSINHFQQCVECDMVASQLTLLWNGHWRRWSKSPFISTKNTEKWVPHPLPVPFRYALIHILYPLLYIEGGQWHKQWLIRVNRTALLSMFVLVLLSI